ncbi:ABC transporter permease [Weissella soli]|uniref:4-amino-4-deoxy-L-arabinose transferase-like glycosyltransferase n=1 Tax=Weissella soli TaxID=155866 RepID=A0A288Q921_9LACO|nr:ABC transporter permease [Weissella soli]AOT56340.1 hypothetical protein WSWS_00704 [Weissella soli]RDL11912.1 4-amino-4-deoxy-L-arabinose transferase-like glycosyltransferase [Weissella soli]
MLNILGTLFFFLSLNGYNFVLKKMGVTRYLAWITTMAIQILMLYAFAMLDFLQAGIIGVTSLGGLFFIWSLVEYIRQPDVKAYQKESVHYFDIWMVLFGIAFIVVLAKSPLIHYDNYSHWATIVKYMVFEGHLPVAHQSLVTFTSYPPALALFITHFVTWVGFSAGNMLIGQFLLIWSALYAMFGMVRDRTRALNTFIIAAAIAVALIFNISIRLNNLLVDFVLPLLAIVGIVGIYIYRRKLALQITHTTIFIAVLLLSKNSGMFYAVILAIYLCYQIIKNSTHQKSILKIRQALGFTGLSLILGYLPFYWWQNHVAQTFAGVSKHEISLQAYESQVTHEGQQMFTVIAHKMTTQVFSLNSLSSIGFLLVNLTLIIIWAVLKFGLHKQNILLKVLIALDVIMVAYYLSIYAMYVVSMPYPEAIVLAGFERYMSSIVVFNLLVGAMAITIAIDYAFYEPNIEQRNFYSYSSVISKQIYQWTAFILFVFATILMLSELNGTEFSNEQNMHTLPVELTQIAKPQYRLNNKKVLIVDPHKDMVKSQYTELVGRYYFFDGNVTARENFMMSAADFKQTVNSYDYIVIPEWHSTFSTMTRKVYHQHIRTGMYKVENNHLVKVD